MRTPIRRWAIPALAALVPLAAACGDDNGGATTAAPTTTAAATTAPTTAPPTVATTAPAPATTVPPTTVPPTTIPPTSAPPTTAAGLIRVTVGTDSGPNRVEKVKVGQPITLEITNPASADEYHVHGVDLGDNEKVPKGVTKTFKFTLTKAGSYEVESHATKTVLVVIEAVA